MNYSANHSLQKKQFHTHVSFHTKFTHLEFDGTTRRFHSRRLLGFLVTGSGTERRCGRTNIGGDGGGGVGWKPPPRRTGVATPLAYRSEAHALLGIVLVAAVGVLLLLLLRIVRGGRRWRRWRWFGWCHFGSSSRSAHGRMIGTAGKRGGFRSSLLLRCLIDSRSHGGSGRRRRCNSCCWRRRRRMLQCGRLQQSEIMQRRKAMAFV